MTVVLGGARRELGARAGDVASVEGGRAGRCSTGIFVAGGLSEVAVEGVRHFLLPHPSAVASRVSESRSCPPANEFIRLFTQQVARKKHAE